MESTTFPGTSAPHLLATLLLAFAVAPLSAQPLNEMDKLHLVDEALQYAAREDRNDATAIAKLEDALKRVDNLAPVVELELREAVAQIYHDKALREVNRQSAIFFETQDYSALTELSVDEAEWRDAVDAWEAFAAWAAPRFPVEAAKALGTTSELYQWQRKAVDEWADVLIRLRALLATVTPQTRDERFEVERLNRRVQQRLREITPRLSEAMQARVREAMEVENPRQDALVSDTRVSDNGNPEAAREDIATLLDRRAPERFQAAQRVIVADDEGQPVDMIEHERASAGDIVAVLRKAYAPIALSVESGLATPEERIPFDVLANMRLEDALKLMVERSAGHADWILQDGRLIVQFAETREGIAIPAVLSRPFPIQITATNAGDALLEIELAYNAVYHDIPLQLSTMCLNFPKDTPLPEDFLDDGAPVTVRGALLKLLDLMDDAGVMHYYASVMGYEAEQHFVQVTLSMPLSDCRDDWESGEEYEAFQAYLAERRARMAAYFEQEALAEEN